jgi:chromosomal replication initiation ATPase DnaA
VGAGHLVSDLAQMATARIAELEADLARWRQVLALATGAPVPSAVMPSVALARHVTTHRTARRIPGEPLVERIIDTVAGHYQCSRDEILSHSRRPKPTAARQVSDAPRARDHRQVLSGDRPGV